jgi:hypothetical protein
MPESHDKSMLKIWLGIKNDKERRLQAAFADGDLDAARTYASEADAAESQAMRFANRIFK